MLNFDTTVVEYAGLVTKAVQKKLINDIRMMI